MSTIQSVECNACGGMMCHALLGKNFILTAKENQSLFVDQKLRYSTCHYKLISTLRTWLLFAKLLRKLKSLEWADRLNGVIVHQRISFSRFIDLYMKQIVHERMNAQN